MIFLLEDIKKVIGEVLEVDAFEVFYTELSKFGDVSANVAMVHAKNLKLNPKDLASEYVDKLVKWQDEGKSELQKKYKVAKIFEKIEVAGPGFINFTITEDYINTKLKLELLEVKKELSRDLDFKNKTVLVEYTDPNPFKIFHIGHLMTNVIGEAIARIYELKGADVKRVNYQGDVGRHIAINLYAITKDLSNWNRVESDTNMSLVEKVEWLGQMYARGFAMFDNDAENGEIRSAVAEINKKIYDRSDSNINRIYDTGRSWSLQYFETLYTKLGTKFDKYIFESETAPIGLKLIEEYKNLFIESEGALIYNGEKEGLHTRVFVNSNGLPTYETKDLGNMQIKLLAYPNLSESVVITGNEQIDYFKVVNSVLTQINSNLKDKLKHLGHGMMRFADGKMSSRRGNIIAGDELINNLKEKLRIKFAESRVAPEDLELLLDKVAIAGIKYSVLRQAVGKDIIFDMNKAISTEGDSGPYLQYTHARMYSLTKDTASSLEKVEINESNRDLVLQIIKYADVLGGVAKELEPQKLITYLNELTHSYNTFYNNVKISGNASAEFLTLRAREILADGLNLLGIYAPNEM